MLGDQEKPELSSPPRSHFWVYTFKHYFPDIFKHFYPTLSVTNFEGEAIFLCKMIENVHTQFYALILEKQSRH